MSGHVGTSAVVSDSIRRAPNPYLSVCAAAPSFLAIKELWCPPVCAFVKNSGNPSLRRADGPGTAGSGCRPAPAGILPDNPWRCAVRASRRSSGCQTSSGKICRDRRKMPGRSSSILISPHPQKFPSLLYSTNYCMVPARKRSIIDLPCRIAIQMSGPPRPHFVVSGSTVTI